MTAEPTRPEVCVVVSAYNRRDLLPALVTALQQQDHPNFEAVLVDNGSSDDTHTVLQELTDTDDRFRVLRLEENSGPARARNLGWRSSEAALIAFTDDDCVPAPGWLTAVTAAAKEADLIQGRTVPVRRRERWFERTQEIGTWSGRYETCNLALRRDLLVRLDGFRENFSIAMGEDTDLGLRATAGGAATVFAPDAVVAHHVWPGGFGEFLRQRRRYAELVELMKVNPAARQLLRARLVLRLVHLIALAAPAVAVLGIALGHPVVGLAAAAVMVTGWAVKTTIKERHRGFRWPYRLACSFVTFAGYAYETFCFLAASVRYRTLVI